MKPEMIIFEICVWSGEGEIANIVFFNWRLLVTDEIESPQTDIYQEALAGP